MTQEERDRITLRKDVPHKLIHQIDEDCVDVIFDQLFNHHISRRFAKEKIRWMMQYKCLKEKDCDKLCDNCLKIILNTGMDDAKEHYNDKK